MCSKWGCIEISYCLHEIVVDTQKSHFMMVSHTHKIVSQMEANHVLPAPSWHMVTTLSSAQQTILLPSVSSRSCGEEHPWNQNRVGALTLIARGLHLPITQSLQKSFPNLAYTESPQELFKNRFSGPTPTSTATESLGLEPKNCTVQNALQVILSAASPQLTIWPMRRWAWGGGTTAVPYWKGKMDSKSLRCQSCTAYRRSAHCTSRPPKVCILSYKIC